MILVMFDKIVMFYLFEEIIINKFQLLTNRKYSFIPNNIVIKIWAIKLIIVLRNEFY